ncbi:MAG: S9 family peptidase [Elusimicrobiales bacterium]|nr:S9 family peptidase [Elusimicrobiales bacterium]
MQFKHILSVAVMLAAQPSFSKEIPLRDFFRKPEKAGFDISPDGAFISFLAPYERRMNIFVQKRGTGYAVRVSSETRRDLAGYFWKGNDHLVYVKDFGGDENFHLVSVSRDGGSLRDLTPFEGVRARIIDDLPDSDTDLIIGLNKRNKEIFDAYRLNAVTGVMRLVAENPGNITGWLTDHDGKLRAAIAIEGTDSVLLYRALENELFKPVLKFSYRENFSPQFFTPDNKNLYALSDIGRDKQAVVEFDPAAGKEIRVLYENPEVDVDSLSYSRKRRVLTMARYAKVKMERKFFDAETESLVRDVQARLKGYELSFEGYDKAEDIYVLRAYSDRTKGTYYIYNATAKKLAKLSEAMPWLDENNMAEMRPVSYKSRDGLTINGYLTLPRGVAPENLPVVVNPHGGPWERDTWRFISEIQFLANRGYAVLQMNFRGSTGYGRKFVEASFKQWGKAMQDDITDGVNYLVKEGIADPKRIAIYGGSYGGYATLAGLAFTPDLYACGVDYVGPSNLLTLLASIPPYWKLELEQDYEKIGNPETEKELLKAASPLFSADRIKAPLFVAQGKNDPRVSINESNQIVGSLRRRGVQVEYMVKDNEGHGFHNEENQFDFYEAMEKFLAKHLKRGEAEAK